MIDLSNYSCDKCKRVGSWHCEHCWHTADKPPTRFKCKKKTGIQTPELRKPTTPPPPPTSGSNAQKTPTYNPPPMPPVKPPKPKVNKIMYGLNLYIPLEDLNAYIHEHIDEKYEDQTFVPIKVEVNELDLSIDIKLLSASTVEIDNNRYKINLSELSKEANKCKD